MRFLKMIACVSCSAVSILSTHALSTHALASESNAAPLPGALDIVRMGQLVFASKEIAPPPPPNAKSVVGFKGEIRVHAGKLLRYDETFRSRYVELVERYARENSVPFALVDAVMRVESRYKPGAFSGVAVGLMQIKPGTARDIGYVGTVGGLYAPDVNIMYGVKYLAGAYRRAGGDTCGTVMRYNSGYYAKRPNATNRDYCSKVKAIVAQGNHRDNMDSGARQVADGN